MRLITWKFEHIGRYTDLVYRDLSQLKSSGTSRPWSVGVLQSEGIAYITGETDSPAGVSDYGKDFLAAINIPDARLIDQMKWTSSENLGQTMRTIVIEPKSRQIYMGGEFDLPTHKRSDPKKYMKVGIYRLQCNTSKKEPKEKPLAVIIGVTVICVLVILVTLTLIFGLIFLVLRRRKESNETVRLL